jgi:hypothetical protein
MKTIIGVDPGASGGIAWLDQDSVVHATKMPATEGDILDLLQSIAAGSKEAVAHVELVPIGMPGKGAAMAKLNANAAFIRGCFMALHVRMILIRPVEWQQYYNLGRRATCKSDTEWKNKLKAEAQRRFPTERVTLDTADALLILDYATRPLTTNEREQ